MLLALQKVCYRAKGNGTTGLMRYTLRLLTLQQFQRATLLICALEVIRKDNYNIPHDCNLGAERISIGLFVGGSSLPNKWKDSGRPDDKSMEKELQKISDAIKQYDEKLKIAKAKENISQVENHKDKFTFYRLSLVWK
ncbi:MAG: hypothetical protein IPJ32_19475 [Sphingobacteriaceae bacterium]|nr:hypothetical protein [Sphingobacteriaceae bacterium]